MIKLRHPAFISKYVNEKIYQFVDQYKYANFE